MTMSFLTATVFVRILNLCGHQNLSAGFPQISRNADWCQTRGISTQKSRRLVFDQSWGVQCPSHRLRQKLNHQRKRMSVGCMILKISFWRQNIRQFSLGEYCYSRGGALPETEAG